MTAHEQIQRMLESRLGACVSLDEVLITEQLPERPSRLPDYQAENEGLTALAQELATNPGNVLQKLCDIALKLCHAHSAGISIEEEVDGERIFRWRALAGEMSRYMQAMLPRDFAPCGIVVNENAAQLFTRPVLHFPYVKEVEPYIYEVLLIPFRVAGRPIGTVWVVSSTQERLFDGEDLRLLTNLSQFAAASYQAIQSQEAIQEANSQLAAEVRQHQNLLKTLEVERERLNELYQQTPAFIAVLRGPEHIFERANPPYLQLVGHRDIIGKSVRDALPEIGTQGFLELLDDVYRTGKPFIGKGVRVLLQEDADTVLQERFLDFVYQPLFEVDGSVSGVFVHGVDLTERAEALASVRKSEAHLRSILESSADCIKVLDQDGRLLAMNSPGMCLMEVDDFTTVEGQEWPSLWRGAEQTKAREALSVARTGRRGHFQGYCETAKGNLKWWDVVVTSIPAAEGEPAYFLSVSRDLTELRETAQVLEEKNREIESLNQRLRQSITETHHRVKNNLQLISALIDMQRGADTETVPMSEFVRLGANVRALGVIHDVLTLESKTDSQEETLSVKTVLEKLLAMLQQTVGRGYHFTYSIGDLKLPGRKVTSLALITNELFSNALKHGRGSVEITFSVHDDLARLEVCDNGPGFAADFDATTAANTGLTLIETMTQYDLGGEVYYKNRPEGGARIVVQIPRV